jgi:hypothetical protein
MKPEPGIKKFILETIDTALKELPSIPEFILMLVKEGVMTSIFAGGHDC